MDLEEIFQSCNNVVIEEAGNVIDEKRIIHYSMNKNIMLFCHQKKRKLR